MVSLKVAKIQPNMLLQYPSKVVKILGVKLLFSYILNNLNSITLTVMVDGVDEPDSYMCVVVRH